MKWLAFLFSMYILALSAMPCCNMDCCKDEMRQSANSSHKQEAPCSPFFTCNTCHGFVIPQENVAVLNIVPHIVKMMPVNHDFYLNDFSSTAWQPPRNC